MTPLSTPPRGPRAHLRLRAVAAALRRLAPNAFFIENEVAALGTLVRPGAVCIDIGAEYGLYTFAMADLAGPGGTVYAVEPLPGPARFLEAAIRALDAPSVHLVRRALAGRPGEGTLSLPVRRGLPVHGRAYLTTGADGPGPNAEFHGERLVATEVGTLDELVAERGIERVDVIKADVEGAELAVLDGGRATLTAHRPALLLEIEDRHLAKYGTGAAAVVTRLRGLGYRMSAWIAGRWQQVGEVREGHRNYLFTADGAGRP
ncbi:FkbM family methyltransferase [Nocardiopsis sediminis]|uniref:FkbM family methyltransferase n=1 Tax=Nocardiopsis sediminis TaxID=1778267 RepID=A0ABV8FZY0_9ACTN